MWGAEGTPARLLEATNSIRFQLGQSDRFREGLVRAGAWEAHIAEVFANRGLPQQLAVLPHVESSFNPAAYSKVGAAGLWQFMRSTGRRYMRIDNSVDDRMDPFRSTEAAAQLLAYNYRVLGTWPLALTAYNHGAAGMRRAKEAHGHGRHRAHRAHVQEPVVRLRLAQLLCLVPRGAGDRLRTPRSISATSKPQAEVKFQEFALPSFVPMPSLAARTEGRPDTLRALNPALRPAGVERPAPRAEGLSPAPAAEGEKWTAELLAQRLSPSDQFANQPDERRHRVRFGRNAVLRGRALWRHVPQRSRSSMD